MDEPRDLRRILRDRIRAAEEVGRKNDGEVSSDELDAIDRLKRLVELSDEAKLQRISRWVAAAVVVLGVVVSIALLTIRVRQASITLDLTGTYVAFRPASAITILSPLLPASTIDATRIDSVVVTGRAALRDTTLTERTLAMAATPPATMSLAAMDVMPRESVRFGVSGDRLQIAVGDSAGATKVELNGPVELRGAQRHTLTTRAGSARLWHGAHGAPLSVRVADSALRSLTPVTRIDSLQLYRVATTQTAGGQATHDSSTVVEGKLVITTVDNAATALGPAEALQLEGLDGDLKSVQLRGGALGVSYTGTVRAMYATNGITRRSLMPTLFTYLGAQHIVALIWTSIGWVVLTALSFVRWWRRPG